MSTWNLGIDDVSEEAQAFKDKLASKDTHISAQQTQLMRQTEQIEELQATLNDTLHKLSREATRALQLETELTTCSEDLRNEKISSQNVGQTLVAAQQKIKEKELEARDLQANLESLSHTSDDHSARSSKLEREKATLEARVRELQANIQQITCPPTTPSHRARSSSSSNLRISSLEQQLEQVRASLSQKDADLLVASQKALQAQAESVKIGNEKVAMEKRTSREIAELQEALEEKEEELLYLRGQQNDGTREQALLERIEEDEAKIAALEKLLGDMQDTRGMRERLSEAEERLKQERERAVATEERQVELIREREDAFDDLEHAREELRALKETLSQKEAQIRERYATRCNLSVLHAHQIVRRNTNDTGAVAVSLMDMDSAEPCTTPLIEAAPDESTAATIERMLTTIDRLRGERDTLRRSVEFLETESKFAIEALEAKLATSSPAINDDSATLINQLQGELDALRVRLVAVTDHEGEVIRGKDREIKRLALAATASAIVIQHINSEADHLERRVLDACSSRIAAQEQLHAGEGNLEELEVKVKDLEVKLDVTVLCLEATTSQRNDLMAQLETKDAEREEEVALLKTEHQETSHNLEEARIQLMDVSKALENVESERNSLTVQVANLLTDLRAAQDDLTNAESRYSALQFHQLSSMSSNEATRALQEQISELEFRVLRRTEQVGVHQHDILRMETNIKLQEERLMEMTTELETMSAQKDAMVEDCADAREARDQALERLEVLEVDMEARLEEGDRTIEALIETVFRSVGGARDSLRRAGENSRLVHEDLLRLDGAYQKALALLDEKETLLASEASTAEDAKQSTVALAVSQVGIGKALAYIRQILKEKENLEREIKNQEDNVTRESSQVKALQKQIETLQHQAANTASEFATQTSAFESRTAELQRAISESEAAHQTTVEELVHSKEQLQATLDQAQRSLTESDSDDTIASIQARHAQELGDLQSNLSKSQAALEELRTSHASVKEELEVKLADALKAKEEVEQRLLETSNSLQQSALQKQEVEDVSETLANEISTLRGDLEEARSEIGRVSSARNDLDASYRRVRAELAKLKKDHETRLTEATAQSLLVQQKLQDELTDLQKKLDERSQELDDAVKETDRLARQIQDESNARTADKEIYEKELDSANQFRQQAESTSTKLQHEMELTQTQLQVAKEEVETLQQEKLSLQEEITTLGAEIQRSISLTRYLESEVKESQNKVIAVAEELGQTQADLARSDKAAKAAEVNLSLQSAQHKREMSDLHRQLAALQAQPNLQDALAELEERNNEMEELLRNKCAEIEENDDRALEMLKENKKLATKVESLTRKVQNLQTKLVAAKASIPKTSDVPSVSAPPVEPVPGPSSQPIMRSRANTLNNVPSVPPLPMHAPSPAHRTPVQRVVSVPSSLPRPKTPERRAVQPPPVFKARTPERRAVSSTPMESMASASTIGKKRRAPEDFEACESLAPQGFTADSLPSHELVENTTPRIRRVLSGLQSGFTPVRNHAARPTATMPSPKRLMTGRPGRSPPTIADVTNSPRGSSTKAKGWLGKLRTQATGRSTDVRPRFEPESS
ncbi:hypothetical protein Hypma_015870 [Hypsizygus marmoreus]|uniref:Uncharacterized protein n=1 Tax=Hypsizygus marmoreus TaxID=39966 RepID=A0A369KBN4_HYPMA|nr:hypothetical protein Hypma_015870 [Hypsizygus marmoreus]